MVFRVLTSQLFTGAEEDSNTISSQIVDLRNGKLYFKSSKEQIISQIEVANNNCLNQTNASKGMNTINISSCLNNVSGKYQAVVIADKTYSKYFYEERVLSFSDSNSNSQSCNYAFAYEPANTQVGSGESSFTINGNNMVAPDGNSYIVGLDNYINVSGSDLTGVELEINSSSATNQIKMFAFDNQGNVEWESAFSPQGYFQNNGYTSLAMTLNSSHFVVYFDNTQAHSQSYNGNPLNFALVSNSGSLNLTSEFSKSKFNYNYTGVTSGLCNVSSTQSNNNGGGGNQTYSIFKNILPGQSEQLLYSMPITIDSSNNLLSVIPIYKNSQYSFRLLKSSSTGSTVFDDTYLGNETLDYNESKYLLSVGSTISDSNDNSYFTYTLSDKGDSYNNYNFSILKIDPSGNFLWNNTYSSNSYSLHAVNGLLSIYVEKDSNDNLYVLSNFEYNDSNRNVYLAKINSSGSMLWNKTFEESGEQTGSSLDIYDSNIYIGGTNFSNSTVSDMFVRKLDLNGNTQWVNSFDFETLDKTTDIEADSSGIYVVGIHSEYLLSDNDGSFITSLDSSGNLLWNTSNISSRDYMSISTNSQDKLYVANTKKINSSAANISVQTYNNDGSFNSTLFEDITGLSFMGIMDSNDNYYVSGGENAYISDSDSAYIIKTNSSS